MNKIKPETIFTLVLSAGLLADFIALAGCKSPPAKVTVSSVESAAADRAVGATHAFDVWERHATNNASAAAINYIGLEQAMIQQANGKLACALATVNALGREPATSTSAAAMTVALRAVLDQSSNVVNTVQIFMNPQTGSN